MNEHRWPPLSYEQAMEEYRKKYMDDEDSDEQGGGSGGESDEGEGKTGSGGLEGASRKTKTLKSSGRKEKCKVM